MRAGGGERVLFARVQADVHRRAEQAARADGVTTSQLLRRALDAYLEQRSSDQVAARVAAEGPLPGARDALDALAELER